MVETGEALTIVVRWLHITAGIFWIGLLYYFNVVQVPVFKKFDAATRSNAIQKLVPVALAWFRYSALATVVFGLWLLQRQGMMTSDFLSTNAGVSITAGMTLGIIMFLNVWLIIWPNQRKIIAANVAKAAQGKDIPPEAAAWAKQAFYASRFNFIVSFPMLFFMAGTTHFAASATVTRNDVLGMGVAILVVAVVALWLATGMKPAAAKPPATQTAPPKP